MAGVNNVFENIIGAVFLKGKTGSDAFHFNEAPVAGAVIDGGTKNGRLSDVDISYSGSTLTSTVKYANQDVIFINQSMDISELNFYNIEKIQLADGVTLTMTSDQFVNAMDSLEYESEGSTLNPGLLVHGIAGSVTEKLIINVAADADFQLDDASTAYLFKNLDVTIQFSGGNVRYDGTAASELIMGGSGTEYITPRLGNDTVYAGDGNDLLIGHEGADQLFGENGDDIFLISRLATKANGGLFTPGKASNGKAEWVRGDIINGGDGVDELRITASGSSVSAIEDTVKLTPDNFINIEKVTIGTNIARDSAVYPGIQDQMAAGALTAVTTGIDAINVNGAELTTSVVYTGNNGANMLIGGSAADEFHGNDGNDVLVGGASSDKFYFDTPPNDSSNADTIGDFVSGSDQLVFSHAVFSQLAIGELNSDSLALDAALDANDYLIFTSGKLYYDIDGSGDSMAVLVCQLTGVSALTATDFMVV